MIIYTAIKEFTIKPENILVSIGDTLGKFENSVGVLADGVTFNEYTFYVWVGSTGSQEYLSESGTLPDPSAPSGSAAGGTQVLSAGTETVTISGQSWSFTPSSVVATVCKPVNGANIIVSIVDGTLSADGFNAEFSAPIPSSDYSLFYVVSA